MKQSVLSFGKPKAGGNEEKKGPAGEKKAPAVKSRSPSPVKAISPKVSPKGSPQNTLQKKGREKEEEKKASPKKRERDEVDEVIVHDDEEEIRAIVGLSDDEEDEQSEGKEDEKEEKPKQFSMSKKKTTVTAASAIPNDKYDPVKDAPWKRGESVPYRALADTLALIEATSSRLHIIQHLSNFFRSVICLHPEELITAIYMSTNELGPAFEGIQLGIGPHVIEKAIAQTCGKTTDVVKAMMTEMGDLGSVAMACRQTQRTLIQPKPLTLQGVFKTFREIANMSGKASGDIKQKKIAGLLVAAKDNETRYIVRSLLGSLRIGLAAKSVLVALVQAIVLTPPDKNFPPRILNRNVEGPIRGSALKTLLEESVEIVKEVYSEVPSYETMLGVLLDVNEEYGTTISALREKCFIKAGIPVNPMLAQPTKGITEVLDRFSETGFTCEYKYDGERVQIHQIAPNKISCFSRNLEDSTGKYPDIVRDIPLAFAPNSNIQSFILDCEAVAWDKEHQKRRPFQILATRRKKNVEAQDIEVAVILYAFDILYLNGESLLKRNLQERREILRQTFVPVPDKFAFAQFKDCSTVEDMRDFLEKSVVEDCEGLMVKTLTYNATYEPSKRSYNWLKVKKDYLEGMTDSLDLVPIGAWHGTGKRTGVFGGYLLACYDDESEEFQSITVVGTGFSDAQLTEFTNLLTPSVVEHKPPFVVVGKSGKQTKPDVWLTPSVVWEIRAADLSVSPVHMAAVGLVHESKGIALRFPRILRVRDDKKVEDATTAQQVAQLYRNQGSAKGTIGYGIENTQERTLKQYKAETIKK